MGAKQAQPWLEDAIAGLRPNESVTSVQHGVITLDSVTVPNDALDATPTSEELMKEAEKLRLEGNDAFKSAKDFKGYKAAALIYHRALDFLRRAGGDVEFEARVRNNLALCALRKREWSTAIVYCDAVLAIAPGNGKALYRRALALVELDMFVRALVDLREAHRLCPHDATVKKELDRVEVESRKTMETRRKQFAEVYNVMPQSSVFKDVIPA